MPRRRYGPRPPVADYGLEARDFLEPKLRAKNLAEDQIAKQNLKECESSLEKIDDAIANPASLGTVPDPNVEISIPPVLLERKSLVLDRFKTLRSEQLRQDIIAGLPDQQASRQLIEMIESELATREELGREQRKVQVEAALKEQQARLDRERRETRAAIILSFLQRESVASVVGAILLLGLGITLVVGMFTHVAAPDVITNAFLLILGYFFGQSTTRSHQLRSPEK
jgi:uncharacterized membrane protein